MTRCALCAAFLALFALSAIAQTSQRPTIVAVTIPAISQSNALLRVRFNPNTTGTVRAWFNWGKTTNIANRTPTQLFTGGNNSIVVSNLLTKLATNQTYYFRCTVSNRFGVTRSPILTFKTKHDVQFLDLAATNIESDRASLTATFTAEHSGKTWFRWGGSTNMANTTVPTDYIAGPNAVSITHILTNLIPNKSYYYRQMASNQFGVSSSAISSFSTTLNFHIESVDVSFEGYMVPTQGNFIGRFDRLAECWAWFEWGTDTNAPSSTNPWQPTSHIFGRWFELLPGTWYYCRFVATNRYGRDSTPWKAFRTPTGLNVTTYPAGSGNTAPTGPGYPQGIGAIGSTKSRLGAWIGNYFPTPTDAWFEWGTTTNYEYRTAIAASGLTGFEAFAELNGLQEAGALYHYRAVASNSIGMAFGQNQTFSTPLFPLIMASTNLPQVSFGRTLPGDFNADGRLDLAMVGASPTGEIFQVWLNTESGFSRMNTGLPGFSFPTLSAGDYDNDSRLDILAGTRSTQLRVWRNTGATFSNTFVNEVSMNGCPCTFPVWGDQDNNGRIDILTHYMDAETYDITTVLWQNTPTGMVVFDLHIPPQTAPAAAWGDYDNDGWLDVLFQSLYAPSVLWRNTQTGFTDVASDLPSSIESSISWGDYDNDGWLDLALTGWLETGVRTCEVWRNTGRGFSNIMAHLSPVGGGSGRSYGVSIPGSAQWGDYDNDGKLDLLLYGFAGHISNTMDPVYVCEIWRNTGTGFTNINADFPNLMDGAASWTDHDGDGRLDVALTGHHYHSGVNLPFTQIYRNVHAPPNTPPTAPTSLQVLRTDFGVAFTWLAATDAQTPSSGLSYNIRVGSTPGGVDIVSPNALPDGKRLLLQLGNAQMRRFAYLTGLTNGQTIYWSVQAIDTAFAGGPFAPEESFVYPPSDIWSPPTLSIHAGKLIVSSSLPLPFTIFTSTNLIDWERYSENWPNAESEIPFQSTNAIQFFQLRSP